MSIFDNNSQGNSGRGLQFSDLPRNIFNDQPVDQTSWSWLNLIGQKPSLGSSLQEGVSILPPKYNFLGMNGRWLIDQEKEGGLYTSGSYVAAMDGLRISSVGAGVFKTRRTADPDDASLMCCEVTCTTADTSIAAGDANLLIFPIAGSRVAILRAGKANAKTVTTQFYFKTNVLGIYGVCIRNGQGTRSYVTTINVESTVKTPYPITIPLDVAGTWLYGNAVVGLALSLTLMSGSTYQTTAGSWQAGDFLTTSAQCNFMSSTSNIAYLGEIQMVEGTAAGDIMPQSYQEALAECQTQQRFLDSFLIWNTAAVGTQIHAQSYAGMAMIVVPTPSIFTAGTLVNCTEAVAINTSNGMAVSGSTYSVKHSIAAVGAGVMSATGTVIKLDARL